MDEVMTTPTPEEAADLHRTLSECLVEIDRVRELMKLDDTKIAKSQVRTRSLLNEIHQMNLDRRQERGDVDHEREKRLLRMEAAALRSDLRTLTGKDFPCLLSEAINEKRPARQ